MSHRILLLVAIILATVGIGSSASAPSLDPQAAGIRLHGADEDYSARGEPATRQPLQAGQSMLISFPTPMVAATAFDQPVEAPPVRFTPDVPFQFRWKSATEGELTVRGPVPPDTPYRLGLREGLRNLAGAGVAAPEWGFAWPAAPFRVSISTDEQRLSARPTVYLHFSHPVAAAEVARTAIWRDDRGQTIGTEVQLAGSTDATAATDFALVPLAPLPPGRSYELLVEDTKCAMNGTRLPFVHVFALGATQPLAVEYVRAIHQPKYGAFLELRFDQPLAKTPPAADALRLTPAVKITDVVVEGPDLRLFGAFETGTRYAVEVPPDAVHSRQGFGLVESARWHATFGRKRAAVILPRSILTTPAARGLDVDFTQINTGPLRWQLARIPPERIASVRDRLDEYRWLDTKQRDPRTNEFRLRPTTLLVADLDLPVVAEGRFTAIDGDREVSRTLSFTPEQMVGGAYLLELSGAASDGRIAGNRALVLVNREFLVWKNESTGPCARLFDLATGDPLAGATVTVLGSDGNLLGTAVTRADGAWTPGRFYNRSTPELVLVERNGSFSAHFTDFTGHVPWNRPTERAVMRRHWLFTDRGIYRPGETLHVKGIVRVAVGDTLEMPPAAAPIAWRVLRATDRQPVLDGKTQLSATGAWDAAIALPADLALGEYFVGVEGHECVFKVDEFRAPAFAVELHAAETSPDRTSRARIVSHYFHGAPNAQALVRWRAVWSPHTPWPVSAERGPHFSASDYASPELGLRPPAWARVEGEARQADADARSITLDGTAVLDANGAIDLQSVAPFPSELRISAATVTWEISVVAPDGQTVGAGGGQLVPLARAHPAVAIESKQPGAIELDATAVNLEGELVAGTPLTVTVYHVAEKTVRENISPHVVRYRNTAVPTQVFMREVAAPFHETLSVASTGRYVAVAELTGSARSSRASKATTVAGRATAELAQWDDVQIALQPDRPTYVAGETARVAIRAPFAGRAWVTVETDRVLATFDVALEGNAAYVDVPVTASMHPNAFVQVHLFRPGNQGVPAERLGSCEIRVRRPETELDIATKLAASKAEPGETVRGTITVQCAGKPAADADVTLFAVDEAVLTYGQWHLPEPEPVFFPDRWHSVTTTSGLGQFKPRAEDKALFQKGFLIGDGSQGWRSRFVRSRFLPLAFWQGSVRTDATGRATFSFPAPDNLTDYRIVAVAQHGTEAFGHHAEHVQIARKLQAEPALPRFVRAGDEVDLRAVLRQSEWPELAVQTICRVEGATLVAPPQWETTLTRVLPQPAVFRAKVNDDATHLRVHFAVRGAAPDRGAIDDAVEVELPVHAARIVHREAVTGNVPAEGWTPASALPTTWRDAKGDIDLVVSSSPWLPLLSGLPSVLEYPHGCVEQLSSRILSFALMGDLLRGLPDGDQRAPEYRRRVTDGLARLARAQLGNGDMPYWPGAKIAHPFGTIQTAWAVVEAQRSGWTTPDPVVAKLRAALVRIVRRQDGVRVSPPVRAFALMVAAALELEPKPRVEALELYQQRDVLGDDGRAFLALALHRLDLLPDEKRELVAELTREPVEHVFEPEIFGSSARTAALRLCARATIAGGAWTADERADQHRALTKLMGAAQNFSTQENLWLLLAFRALVRNEGACAAAQWELPFPQPARSADGRAVGWYGRMLADFGREFGGTARLAGGEGTFLLRATYRSSGPEQRDDRGFRLERVVHNLTSRDRDGSAAAPFQLGDELAITFRVLTVRGQAYVALEESLPAAFETVDPAYFRAAHWEKLSALDRDPELALSHWEKRDDRTLWYFDTLPSGPHSYTAIVRVTTAGRFHWPGATIAPMYDARFSGLSDGLMIEVK